MADLKGGLGGQNPPSSLEITIYNYTDSLARNIARLIGYIWLMDRNTQTT